MSSASPNLGYLHCNIGRIFIAYGVISTLLPSFFSQEKWDSMQKKNSFSKAKKRKKNYNKTHFILMALCLQKSKRKVSLGK